MSLFDWLPYKISSNYGIKTQDFITGTSIKKTLGFLQESQYWDSDKIYEYRLKKFKNLVRYVYENVPFYTSTYKHHGIHPDQIDELYHIKKLPVITKEIFRKENFNFVAKNYPKNRVKIGKTGGTTGSPVITYKGIEDRTFTWAAYYRWYEWMGISSGDPMVTLWGARTVLSNSLKSNLIDLMFKAFFNNRIINTFELDEDKIVEFLRMMANSKIVFLRGYLSSIIVFAEIAEKYSIKIPSIKTISSTTETLLPIYRKYVEEIFHCPIFDQYGCGEVSSIAFECSHHNGLHINQEHVILELMNDNFELSTSGKIIVTDLDNYAMPLIRYENGDVASLSDDKCTCGINQPLLKAIDGRTIDTIILKSGTKVHGVFFTDIFYELNIHASLISKFQVYQKIPGEIELRIEEKIFSQDSRLKELEDSLNRYFNSVRIVFCDKLEEEANGKFRYIKSEL